MLTLTRQNGVYIPLCWHSQRKTASMLLHFWHWLQGIFLMICPILPTLLELPVVPYCSKMLSQGLLWLTCVECQLLSIPVSESPPWNRLERSGFCIPLSTGQLQPHSFFSVRMNYYWGSSIISQPHHGIKNPSLQLCALLELRNHLVIPIMRIVGIWFKLNFHFSCDPRRTFQNWRTAKTNRTTSSGTKTDFCVPVLISAWLHQNLFSCLKDAKCFHLSRVIINSLVGQSFSIALDLDVLIRMTAQIIDNFQCGRRHWELGNFLWLMMHETVSGSAFRI